ncbi:MAG: hypothetical protein HY852_24980 [Bradyrhizobium sp.]|uniref:hypothetical protein n=1 Tax=Bradyrhizobium sp. TaxID=376 RepID=UPI0025C69335|nr:hypothetical protein [Bradyrhizobium sp.]MBI5265062.1 hypothetical protein [Bradyrhizobium sp.]
MKSFAIGVVAAAMLSDTACAEDKINLRLGDSLPIGHVIHEAVTKPFIEAVAKRTNGDVTIADFPAEQLGKAKEGRRWPLLPRCIERGRT